MTGTKPFANAYGVWIKRTPYNNTTQNDRIDCVININTGAVYVREGGESGSWVTPNADFATGTARIQATNGEVSTSQVSFGKTFSSTPKVFCNIKTSVPSNKWINAGNINTTGFTIYADVDITGTITVDWFAVAILII